MRKESCEFCRRTPLESCELRVKRELQTVFRCVVAPLCGDRFYRRGGENAEARRVNANLSVCLR
jgi:hypothetical protein